MSSPIIWGGDDAFTHMLVIGAQRTGKSAGILKPLIYQTLVEKKKGKPVGLSVIEPKGDVAAFVAECCAEMDIPCVYIDPLKQDSHIFNVMEGDIDEVAEATVVVLQSLFGKQEAFFATVQELSARYITKLLKQLYGDRIDIFDVIRVLRDPVELEKKVKELKARDGYSDLIHFFEAELLGSLKEKYRQFVIGLRAQLENLTSNTHLRRILSGKSNINLDEHFEEGGVLAVNTALGRLGKAGDAFGQFVMMHLQNATFRRGGTERTRVPHYLICDEFGRYINPDIERFLSVSPEYRVAAILAIQSLGQLEIESGKISAKAMKRTIMTTCRNKIVFGGLSAEDAKELSEEFGKRKIIERQSTFSHRTLIPSLFPETYRDTEKEEYWFYYSQLMYGLPRFHYVYKFVKDGHPQPPGIGKAIFVPRDWKERREWEKGASQGSKSTLISSLHEKTALFVSSWLDKIRKQPSEQSEPVMQPVPDERAKVTESIQEEPVQTEPVHSELKQELIFMERSDVTNTPSEEALQTSSGDVHEDLQQDIESEVTKPVENPNPEEAPSEEPEQTSTAEKEPPVEEAMEEKPVADEAKEQEPKKQQKVVYMEEFFFK